MIRDPKVRILPSSRKNPEVSHYPLSPEAKKVIDEWNHLPLRPEYLYSAVVLGPPKFFTGEHMTVHEEKWEFTISEQFAMSLVGVPISGAHMFLNKSTLKYDGKNGVLGGIVLASWVDEFGKTRIAFKLFENKAGQMLNILIRTGECRDVSLTTIKFETPHPDPEKRMRGHTMLGEKQVVEISVCEKGYRDGTHIYLTEHNRIYDEERRKMYLDQLRPYRNLLADREKLFMVESPDD